MSIHRYRFDVLRGDFVRAATGTLLSIGALALAQQSRWAMAVFAGAAALFLAFGLRTAARMRIWYEMTEGGLVRRNRLPLSRDARLPWSSLDTLSLRFYSTRRDRSQGWMQLTLKGGGARISLDSTLDDFDAVARAAASAAASRGLRLRTSTLANLEALGINTERLGLDRR